MDISAHLSKNKGNRIDQIEYFYIIKSLMYVMNYTRPDIVYLVSKQVDLQVNQPNGKM